MEGVRRCLSRCLTSYHCKEALYSKQHAMESCRCRWAEAHLLAMTAACLQIPASQVREASAVLLR
jgi:hypothetical protein